MDCQLDNPVWYALTGPHARFARRVGVARRYPPDVGVFAGVDRLDRSAALDLAQLASDDRAVVARADIGELPSGLPARDRLVGKQFVLDHDVDLSPPPHHLVVHQLGPADAAAAWALARLTRPGPFAPCTIELGGYVGVREGGRLVAMAGRRFLLDGWCEISGVCTHPDARGRGLAAALTTEVARGIRADGMTPFLHVAEDNVAAMRVYDSLGFRHRTDIFIVVLGERGGE